MQDLLNHFEVLGNPQRKHARIGILSPITFEQLQKMSLQGVYRTQGYSNSRAVQFLDPEHPDLAESFTTISPSRFRSALLALTTFGVSEKPS